MGSCNWGEKALLFIWIFHPICNRWRGPHLQGTFCTEKLLPNPPWEIHKIRIATWTAQVLLAETWGKFSCRVVDLALNQAAKPCKPKARSIGTICADSFRKSIGDKLQPWFGGRGTPLGKSAVMTGQPTNQPPPQSTPGREIRLLLRAY